MPLGEGEVGSVAGCNEAEGRHRRRLEDGLHGEGAREHERGDDDSEEARAEQHLHSRAIVGRAVVGRAVVSMAMKYY